MSEKKEERLKMIESEVSSLISIVGETDKDGLRGDIAKINISLKTIIEVLKMFRKLLPTQEE